MLGIVAGSGFGWGWAEFCWYCLLVSLGSDMSSGSDMSLGSDMMRSMRRPTTLLRSVALPTSARGARLPSSGWVVISSTISMGSGLALGWVAGFGRFRLAIWRP